MLFFIASVIRDHQLSSFGTVPSLASTNNRRKKGRTASDRPPLYPGSMAAGLKQKHLLSMVAHHCDRRTLFSPIARTDYSSPHIHDPPNSMSLDSKCYHRITSQGSHKHSKYRKSLRVVVVRYSHPLCKLRDTHAYLYRSGLG